jgi:hypothetical protein
LTNFTLKLSQIDKARKNLVGGKALAVAKMFSKTPFPSEIEADLKPLVAQFSRQRL